ncbi:hypothetical protein BHE74_00024356 [Ensete ventricosum]|nr:hypothetical protein BHE74_00024356 [Ensete ventricosum]
MDDSWLAKCVAPPPPLPPFPAPASTPTVPPQQLPLSPASAGQVSMILRHRFPSFLAQEALLKDQARSQETSASDTLNLSSYRLGKTELGNSFLSLLSGKFSQLPNSRMDIAKPQVSNDDKILSGSGCVVPSINIPPLPENHGDNAPENWNELSSFVASRPSVNSASLHNSAQVAGNSYHDMDSIELVSQQSSKCNNTGFALNSTRSGWSTSNRYVDCPLPGGTANRSSFFPVTTRNRPVTIDFDLWRSISGGIRRRGRRKARTWSPTLLSRFRSVVRG